MYYFMLKEHGRILESLSKVNAERKKIDFQLVIWLFTCSCESRMVLLILSGYIFTARIRRMGNVMFVIDPLGGGGGGYPSPRFLPRSLVPGSFQGGGTPVPCSSQGL